MHRTASTSFAPSVHNDEDSKDSGIGECGWMDENAPVDFTAMMVTSKEVSVLDRNFCGMHIRSTSSSSKSDSSPFRTGAMKGVRPDDILLLDDDDGIDIETFNDENDGDSSFSKMPPPSFIPFRPSINANRRPLADISNRLTSPVSSKSTSARRSHSSVCLSSGRKRPSALTRTQSEDGTEGIEGKRWRMEETIHEELELCSSQATSSSSDSSLPPRPISHFLRVQSTSVLERGIYAHHTETVPEAIETNYTLNTVAKVDSQAFRRISGETLVDLMGRLGDDQFNKMYLLIDCRYPFEYNGGHIKHAINIFDPNEVQKNFLEEDNILQLEDGETKRIPIFYCEFSQKRGPGMATTVRKADRAVNALAYPRLEHAEMYVLDKGYNDFHAQHGNEKLCTPYSYIRMEDCRFSSELKRYSYHKKSFSATATISRLPPAATADQRQRRRRETGGSPTMVRRGLFSPSSPRTPSTHIAPIINPHFS